ncbi:MAG TPA: TcpQ domain-containing protein, partial [Micavibrio sp.]
MPYVRSLLFWALGLATLSAGTIIFPASSQAGFEFKPSPAIIAPAEPALPPVPAMPAESVESTTLAPQPAAAQPEPQAQLPMQAVQPMQSMQAMPLQSSRQQPASDYAPPADQPAASFTTRAESISKADDMAYAPRDKIARRPLPPAIVPVAPAPAASTFPNVVGFGRDIPLVLALREIVPPQYAYSFEPSVDAGARITWNGGKPWDTALSDALKPIGLGAEITGTTVIIAPLGKMKGAQTQNQSMADPAAMPANDVPPGIVAEAHDAAGKAPAVKLRASAPVREVYIRRNDSEARVVDRTPGEPSVIGAAPTKEEDPSFWSRLKKDIVGDSEQPARSAPRPPVEQTQATPPVNAAIAMQAPSEPVSLTQDNMDPSALPTLSKKHVLDPYAIASWQAAKGDSLKRVLQNWSQKAGVEVQWNSAEDYTLPEEIRLSGNYTEAVTRVLTSYGEVE